MKALRPLRPTGSDRRGSPGATLRMGGDYAQTGAAQLVAAGTTRVQGAVQVAADTTLELRGGEPPAT